MPAAHLYVLVEFIFLTLFYSNYVKKYVAPKYIPIAISIFILFTVLNAVFIQKVSEYPSVLRVVESIIIVIFSILYFHKVMVESKITKLSREPMIWVNTDMLVYFSGNFFFHILLPIGVSHLVNFATFTVYYFWITNVMFYLILAIGFYKQKRLVEQ